MKEEQYEDRRQMAVDILNGIDNTNMTSDGLIRHAMDLMCNYGYTTYRKAMRTVLEYYNANPKMYRNDIPTRYTYMGQLWREEYPDAYETYREELRAKREAQKIAEEKTIVNQMISDLAHDLANRDQHNSMIGFEPTDGEGQ
jgi:hypothetical protein